MNYSMVKRLILKDWYLQRKLILGALIGGAVSLGIIMVGGKAAFLVGLVLLLTVLIACGAMVAMSTTVQERKDQTLAFVMSLPISYREYTTAKLLGNLLIFMIPWLALVLGSLGLFLVPHGIPHGLLPFTAIMSTEILLSTCLIVTVAIVTESQTWCIAAILVGDLAINIVGYYVAHIPSIAQGMPGSTVRWTSTASTLLVLEFAMIVLLFAGTFFLQSRKRDFL
jgi:ABC-2 type transport system permease protein